MRWQRFKPSRLKDLWEDRFERRYGFWRAFYDTAVLRYLDCGLFESGFARAICPKCRFEFLVAFSCKGRGLCLFRHPLAYVDTHKAELLFRHKVLGEKLTRQLE